MIKKTDKLNKILCDFDVAYAILKSMKYSEITNLDNFIISINNKH